MGKGLPQMIYLLMVIAFCFGFWMREVLNSLKRIIAILERLRGSQPQTPKQANQVVGEITKAEMLALMDQERVDALNQK